MKPAMQPRPCACGPEVEVGGYQNQMVVAIPDHMADYKAARVAAGKTPFVGIDACAMPEIRALWDMGIRTYGSCCGHGTAPTMVNVHPEDDARMLALGYVRWPYIPDGFCKETFFLKSLAIGREPQTVEGQAA